MKNGQFRIGLVVGVFIFLYAVLVYNFFYWQVLRHDELRVIGEKQSTESLIEEQKRGEILFSDNFPIATNKTKYLLYANPKVVTDRLDYGQKLSPLIESPEASIAAQLSKDLFWVKLATSLDSKQKKEIENLKLSGLGFSALTERFYPEASIAAHLVGFVGKNTKDESVGYFGLEGYYNDLLSGRPGKLYVVRDAFGNQIVGDVREEKKIDGKSLVLTVDRTIQFIAQKKLKDAVERYGAEGGSIIVMETQTGKLLAMASFPAFDNQKYYEYDASTYKNPIISDLYEPGSTFKVLIMGAALDKGVVKPDTKCDICAGPVQIGEYSVKTWNDKYYPNTTMTDVIKHSDNTGMVFVGRKLGLTNLLSYFEKFGIGKRTGIDLQGEVASQLRDKDSWYAIDAATATFGQGISVTSLELLTAVNSIANDGILMKPYVVSKIIDSEGKTIEIKPEEVKRTISSAAAKAVNLMMVNAVENGEAKFARIKNYKIAGKTGTAQIPVAGHYDPNQTIASFIGFFPSEKPQISMFVIIKRPQSSIYGADTAAPVFFSVAKDIISYYNIPPSN